MAVCFAGVFPWVSAQELQGNLTAVQVQGTSESRARIVQVNLVARAGTPVASINLEAERNRVLRIGEFAEVTVLLEDRGRGPVLIVRVVENSTIAGVRLEGVTSFPAATVQEINAFLQEENLLATGSILNTFRAQEARGTIQQVYRQAGFPFDVPVALSVNPVEADAAPPADEAEGGEPSADPAPTPEAPTPAQTPAQTGQVQLVYTVTENVPLQEVTFEGSTVLSDERLSELTQPLRNAQTFSAQSYQQVANQIAQAYNEQGYRGSGVNPQSTTLTDGTLTLRLRELRIASINTTAIGVDPGELSVRPGDLYNYDELLEEVRRLAAGRTRDIFLQDPPPQTQGGEVRVVFEASPPDTAGPIGEVRLEGNTVISDGELLQLLTLAVGDTFTSALAREDFRRIAELYAERGYVLVPEPSFAYQDGVYTQRIQEVRIAGYEVVFQGESEARTDPTVVTRYLPAPGSVYSEDRLRVGLLNVARLRVVEPSTRNLLPTDAPDERTVQIVVRDINTRTFSPSASYDTLRGLSADVSYGDANLFGQAHDLSASLSAQTSDLGFLLGGSVAYSIPWLYADFLDFEEVPTSVSASLFSTTLSNQALSRDGSLRAPLPGVTSLQEDDQVLIGEYTQRDTGLSFGLGRPVFDNTTLSFSARGSYAQYLLEPPRPCTIEDGTVTTPNCTLPEEAVLEENFLPQSGLSSFVATGLTYDDRDIPDFPRTGLFANTRLGFGFGSDFRNPDTQAQQAYNYQQLEFGVRTYLTPADLFGEGGDRNHVVAVRLSAGQQFGRLYPDSRLFAVGETPANINTQIRGYRRSDFGLSRSYVTGSLEYRYDFGLSTAATETIIGIVFTDIGYLSNVPGFDEYGAPLFASAGVGVQFNLGFGGFALPPIRFDYGFSERNPGGVFSFRLGPVF